MLKKILFLTKFFILFLIIFCGKSLISMTFNPSQLVAIKDEYKKWQSAGNSGSLQKFINDRVVGATEASKRIADLQSQLEKTSADSGRQLAALQKELELARQEQTRVQLQNKQLGEQIQQAQTQNTQLQQQFQQQLGVQQQQLQQMQVDKDKLTQQFTAQQKQIQDANASWQAYLENLKKQQEHVLSAVRDENDQARKKMQEDFDTQKAEFQKKQSDEIEKLRADFAKDLAQKLSDEKARADQQVTMKTQEFDKKILDVEEQKKEALGEKEKALEIKLKELAEKFKSEKEELQAQHQQKNAEALQKQNQIFEQQSQKREQDFKVKQSELEKKLSEKQIVQEQLETAKENLALELKRRSELEEKEKDNQALIDKQKKEVDQLGVELNKAKQALKDYVKEAGVDFSALNDNLVAYEKELKVEKKKLEQQKQEFQQQLQQLQQSQQTENEKLNQQIQQLRSEKTEIEEQRKKAQDEWEKEKQKLLDEKVQAQQKSQDLIDKQDAIRNEIQIKSKDVQEKQKEIDQIKQKKEQEIGELKLEHQSQLDSMQTQLAGAAQLKKQLEEKLDIQVRQISDQFSKLDVEKQKTAEFAKQAAELKRLQEQLKTQDEAFEKQKAEFGQLIVAAEKQKEEALTDQTKKFEVKQQELEDKLKKEQADLQAKFDQIKDTSAKLQAQDVELQELRKQKQDFEQQIQQQKQDFDAKQSERAAQYQKDLREQREQQEAAIANQIAAFTQEKKVLDEALKKEKADFEKQSATTRQQLAQQQEDIEQQRKQLEETQKKLEQEKSSLLEQQSKSQTDLAQSKLQFEQEKSALATDKALLAKEKDALEKEKSALAEKEKQVQVQQEAQADAVKKEKADLEKQKQAFVAAQTVFASQKLQDEVELKKQKEVFALEKTAVSKEKELFAKEKGAVKKESESVKREKEAISMQQKELQQQEQMIAQREQQLKTQKKDEDKKIVEQLKKDLQAEKDKNKQLEDTNIRLNNDLIDVRLLPQSYENTLQRLSQEKQTLEALLDRLKEEYAREIDVLKFKHERDLKKQLAEKDKKFAEQLAELNTLKQQASETTMKTQKDGEKAGLESKIQEMEKQHKIELQGFAEKMKRLKDNAGKIILAAQAEVKKKDEEIRLQNERMNYLEKSVKGEEKPKAEEKVERVKSKYDLVALENEMNSLMKAIEGKLPNFKKCLDEMDAAEIHERNLREDWFMWVVTKKEDYENEVHTAGVGVQEKTDKFKQVKADLNQSIDNLGIVIQKIVDANDQKLLTQIHNFMEKVLKISYLDGYHFCRTSEEFMQLRILVESNDLNGFAAKVNQLYKDKFKLFETVVAFNKSIDGKNLLHVITKSIYDRNLKGQKVNDWKDLLVDTGTDGFLEQLKNYISASNLNVADSNKVTPLHYAIWAKNKWAIELFSQKGANWAVIVDQENTSPLNYLIDNDYKNKDEKDKSKRLSLDKKGQGVWVPESVLVKVRQTLGEKATFGEWMKSWVK